MFYFLQRMIEKRVILVSFVSQNVYSMNENYVDFKNNILRKYHESHWL